MAPVRTHKDLIVWRKAVSLASRVHELTAHFASRDHQTLSAQMRRCSVAVASGIAEGAASGSRAEYIRFLDLARSALSELETQACICLELRILESGTQLDDSIAEVGRLLSALIRRLRAHRERASGFEPPLRPPSNH
jgi:four helix bundle protein